MSKTKKSQPKSAKRTAVSAKRAAPKKSAKAKPTKAKRTIKLSQAEVIKHLQAEVARLSAAQEAVSRAPKALQRVGRVEREVEAAPVKVAAKAAPVQVPARKVRGELWVYDEYNQGSIVANGGDLAKLVERARAYVNEANVENALAAGEKNKAWEAYYPEIFENGVPSTSMIYAGNKRDGNHYIYVDKDGKWTQMVMPKGIEMKFFLGTIPKGRLKEEWYLADHRGREITSINDSLLERKAVLFLKVVG